jgi:hypothetical protein
VPGHAAGHGRTLSIARDFGENRVAALANQFVAAAEALAGDPAAAERHLRWGIRVLERQGESGLRSNLTAELAHVLHDLGRPDEALRFAMTSRVWPPTTTCSRRSAGVAGRPGRWPGRAGSTRPSGWPPRPWPSPSRPTC